MENNSFNEFEKALKKLGVRSRTFILHQPRNTINILSDLSKKWNNFSEEEKKLVYDNFERK